MNPKKGMIIKGEYRDVISKRGESIKDSGWKSNTIAPDYGKFLAALMKKEFNKQGGIDYIAVGSSGTEHNFNSFSEKVVYYFINDRPIPQPGQPWVWAQEIKPMNITYLDENDEEVGEMTNKLKIEVTIGEDEPSTGTFDFFEFALVGIYRNQETAELTEDNIFFINYVNHGQITKDNTMELTRTIKLTFPINQNEEENHE